MAKLTTILFDADDTLWHNERMFHFSHERFVELLSQFANKETVEKRLLETERRNLRVYGYGAKGFTLSMIETALEITDHRIDGRAVSQIVSWGRELLTYDVEPLPGVMDTLKSLKDDYQLYLVTKGDLFDQERKIADSGLADYFADIEIVSEKDEQTYHSIFERHSVRPVEAMMVGNSVKSDVLPALACGAYAAYIPYEVTWELEKAREPSDHPRFYQLGSMNMLVDLIISIETGES